VVWRMRVASKELARYVAGVPGGGGR
jgi:hypothetical protein